MHTELHFGMPTINSLYQLHYGVCNPRFAMCKFMFANSVGISVLGTFIRASGLIPKIYDYISVLRFFTSLRGSALDIPSKTDVTTAATTQY